MSYPRATDLRPSPTQSALAPADAAVHFCCRGDSAVGQAVDLSSVRAVALWGEEVEPYGEGVPTPISVSDIPGVLSARNRADVLATESGGAWAVEHTEQDVRQDGGLLFLMDAPADGPWGMEVDVKAPVLSGASDVLPNVAIYAGAGLYFLDGPSGRAIVVLYAQVGDDRSAIICTSSGASGNNRVVLNEVEVDWSSTLRWRVMWDGADTRTVQVLYTTLELVDDAWVEVIEEMAYEGELPQVVFANMRVGGWVPGCGQVGCAVVLDSLTDSDRIEVGRVWGAASGGWLVRSGAGARGHAALIRSNAGLQEDASHGTDWTAEGDVTRADLATSISYADGVGALSCEEEIQGGWLLWVRGRLERATHVGSLHTGAALEIGDGTHLRAVTFLYNYITRSVGLLQGEDTGLPADYAEVEVDWREDLSLEWIGDAESDVQHLYLEGSAYPDAAVDLTPADLPGTDRFFVRIGAGTGTAGSGLLLVDQARLIPGAYHYLPALGNLPADQGWSDVVDVEWTLNADIELVISGGAGQTFFYRNNGEDPELRGAVVTAQLRLVSWARGSEVSPRRAQVGPFLWLGVRSRTGVGLCGVQDANGEWWVYLQSDHVPVQDILRQTPNARRISAQVDSLDGRWWLFRNRPDRIEVWKDNGGEPVISLPWEERDLVEAEDAHEDLDGAWVGVGSMQEGLGVAVLRASAGQGLAWHVHLPAMQSPVSERLGTSARVSVLADEV